MDDDNVIPWPGVTRLPVPVADVLEGARKCGLSEVVICGFTEDGDEYFASSEANGASVLWLLARSQHRLMCIAGEDDDG